MRDARAQLAQRRERGFTVVELVIVMGIIGLLAALLLPAVGRARQSALRVACASNLRQIGIGFIAYAHDHRGWLPAPAIAGLPFEEDWVHWQPSRDVRRGSLMPYLNHNAEVLKCPIGVPERGETVGLANRRYPPYPFSYSVNTLITGMSTGPSFRDVSGCRLHQVRNASHKILALEEDVTDINDGSWYQGGDWVSGMHTLVSVRHDRAQEVGIAFHRTGQLWVMYVKAGRGNVVFADGHCEFLERLAIGTRNYDNPREP